MITLHVYHDTLTEFLMLYNHAFSKCICEFLIAFSRLLLRAMIHSIFLYAICFRRTIISPFLYSCIFFLPILSQIPLSQQLTAEFRRLIRRKYIQLILCPGHTYIEKSSFFLVSFKFFFRCRPRIYQNFFRQYPIHNIQKIDGIIFQSFTRMHGRQNKWTVAFRLLFPDNLSKLFQTFQ